MMDAAILIFILLGIFAGIFYFVQYIFRPVNDLSNHFVCDSCRKLTHDNKSCAIWDNDDGDGFMEVCEGCYSKIQNEK